MERDFCVEFVDQCGEVFITHPSIQSAKEHLAELPQIPNACQNLKQLGVEVLNIVVKLDSSVGVCVGQIELGEKIVIKIDDTWCEAAQKCGAEKWQGIAWWARETMDSKAMDCHADKSARNDSVGLVTHASGTRNDGLDFWKTLKMWFLKSR